MTPRKGPPRGPGPPSSTTRRRDTILLEQIQEQNRATLEAVFSLDQKLTRQREESELKLTRRLDALEAAVRINGEDIRKNSEDIRKNSQDIQRMTQEIREMRVMLERK